MENPFDYLMNNLVWVKLGVGVPTASKILFRKNEASQRMSSKKMAAPTGMCALVPVRVCVSRRYRWGSGRVGIFRLTPGVEVC